MSGQPAITVNSVSKVFKLYDKPSDRLKETLSLGRRYHREFYALKDVSFEVERGQCFGIIGQNGAGKSTILKIITGVLSPSSGTVVSNGRISSLLELGAGFNHEMTGLENIYLNGMIMGFSRQEMTGKIEAIQEFADIGDFIFQPVKTYSSGMFARLAFALSINVEPDILIIDEALSVGDAAFQRRCYAKFNDLREKNTTVILVSHDMDAIKSYTSHAAYFREGRVDFIGVSDKAVARYFQDIFPNMEQNPEKVSIPSTLPDDEEGHVFYEQHGSKTYGHGFADFKKIVVTGLTDGICFKGGSTLIFKVHINWSREKVTALSLEKNLKNNIIIGMYIDDVRCNRIFAFNSFLSGCLIDPQQSESAAIHFEITMPDLSPGDYFLSPSIALGEHHHHVQLKWVDQFGMIKSTPDNPLDFLGFVRFDYKTEKLS